MIYLEQNKGGKVETSEILKKAAGHSEGESVMD